MWKKGKTGGAEERIEDSQMPGPEGLSAPADRGFFWSGHNLKSTADKIAAINHAAISHLNSNKYPQ
jgi:hypothetical protein